MRRMGDCEAAELARQLVNAEIIAFLGALRKVRSSLISRSNGSSRRKQAAHS